MRLVSSRLTFLHKRIFPAVWFGALAIFAVGIMTGDAPKFLLTVVLAMAGIGYLVFSRLVFPLADEVLNAGDVLIIRRGQTESRLPFSEIADVRYARFYNPERATLAFWNETAFGREITFLLPFRFNIFARSPIALDLRRRVSESRQ